MPRAVDLRIVEAARLRRSGAGWDAAFEKAGVEDTSPARQPAYRIIREAKEEAMAEAAKAEAKAKAKARAAKAKAGAAKAKAAKAELAKAKAEAEAAKEDKKNAKHLKLLEARKRARLLSAKQSRVKEQGQGMAKKLKVAREQGHRVKELEREVLGLKDELAAAQAATVPFKKELYPMRRDFSKRGAPYDPTFEELIAPAMMASGAPGNVIGEILRTCTLLAFCSFYL